MKKEKDSVLPKMVRKVVKAARSSEHDPLGSYTGTPAGGGDEGPTQDAFFHHVGTDKHQRAEIEIVA